MGLLILALVLYFGGRWLVKTAGPMPHLCRGCAQIYRGTECPRCCEHGDDRPNCEQCLLDGKRIDAKTVAATGEYEPPQSFWADDREPTDEELFGQV